MTIFSFANTEKARKSTEQQFPLVENRRTTRIGVTTNVVVVRSFRIVKIEQLQSLRSNSREFGGVLN